VTTVVVVPSYNAGRHVRSVVLRIAASGLSDLAAIIVVDDGSTDGTSQKLEEVPPLPCAFEVIRRPRNGGYGAAMKDGLERAIAQSPVRVACVHADGQYSPEVLPFLVDEMTARGLDILQGSRVASGTALSGGMPIYKYAANAVLNRIENHTLGLSMTDYHSGYLLYGRRALASLPYRAFSDSFDFDLELIARARARGLRVGEAPVPTRYGDEISHLNPITYGLRVLKVLWNYRRGRYVAA